MISNDLDTAKNKYLASRLSSAVTPDAKWKQLRSLHITKSTSTSPFSVFTPSLLNNFYASVVNQALPANFDTFNSIVNSHISTTSISQSEIPSFYFDFSPVSLLDVKRVVNSATSKGKGQDGISVEMLKFALPSTLIPLTKIINESLLTAIFPSDWKKTLIIPLAKSKIIKTPSDTRPIAQISELSKAPERIVHEQLTGYLETNDLLFSRQAGFRRGHSTTTALACVIDDIRQAIDRRMITILILFDFSKAFDSIPHKRLLQKLHSLKVSNRVLHWFFSYLTDRIQTVVDGNGKISEWLRAASGVPQGSVLGPLLFAIYINDLPTVLRLAKIMIFADDTQIYHHCLPSKVLEGLALMTLEAQSVADWAAENGMVLNELKTRVMILGSEQFITQLKTIDLPKVTINGVEIPFATEVKNLGLIMTPTLNFAPHVSSLVKRVNSTLYVLRRYRSSLTFSLKKEPIECLIFPIIDYASPVYGDLDKTRTIVLQRAQNACVRFVYGNIPYTAHVTPYRIRLGWLSSASRREFLTGSLAFSILARNTPDYLTQAFTSVASQDVRRSARNPPAALLYATPRTEAWKNSFAIRATCAINRTTHANFSEILTRDFRRSLIDKLWESDITNWSMQQQQNLRLVPSL